MDSSYDAEHQTNHPAGTPQGQEAGGNQQRVPADCAKGSTLRTVAGDCAAFANDPDFLRFISYARACRSRAAVLCASTDAQTSSARSVGPVENALLEVFRKDISDAVVADLVASFAARAENPS